MSRLVTIETRLEMRHEALRMYLHRPAERQQAIMALTTHGFFTSCRWLSAGSPPLAIGHADSCQAFHWPNAVTARSAY